MSEPTKFTHYDIAEVTAMVNRNLDALKVHLDDPKLGPQARMQIAATLNVHVSIAEEINRGTPSRLIIEALATMFGCLAATVAESVPRDASVPDDVNGRLLMLYDAFDRTIEQAPHVEGYYVAPMQSGRA